MTMMRTCAICQNFSGLQSVCWDCATMIWPHRQINPGAKELSRALLLVPELTGPSVVS
jgi:hypothetical protein